MSASHQVALAKPVHHGDAFMAFELAALVVASVALWRRGGSWRWLGGGGLACMAAFAAFALSQWSELGAP
jgi:hypothetical protein